MSDLANRIRDHYDSVSPVAAEEVFAMVTDSPLPLREQAQPGWLRRNPVAVAVTAAMITLLAVGAVALALRSEQPTPAATVPPTTVATVPPTTAATVPPTTAALSTETTAATATVPPLDWTAAERWTRSDFGASIDTVVFFADRFAIYGEAGVWLSEDGSTWQGPEAIPLDARFLDVSVVDDVMFASGVVEVDGRRAVTVWKSRDGVDWEQATGDGFALDTSSVIEDRSRVVIGTTGDGFVMAGAICDPTCEWRSWFSEDGLSWIAGAANGLGEQSEDGVLFPTVSALLETDRGLLAGGAASTESQRTPYPVFMTTEHGDSWVVVDGAGPGQVGAIEAIVRSNSGYVALTGAPTSSIQPDGAQIYFSADGVEWRWVTSVPFFPSEGSRFLEGIAAAPGWFLIYGTEDSQAFALMSDDGQTWTQLSSPTMVDAKMLSAAGSDAGLVVIGEACSDFDTCRPVVWTWSVPD